MPVQTTYTYSIANDFPSGKVNTTNFASEIEASSIVTALYGINTSGDEIDVIFKDALSVADKTTLDGNTTGPAGGLIAATNNSSTSSSQSNVISFEANISNDGVLNGTTPVTIVSAPSPNAKRIVRTLNISNSDTADVICTLYYKNGVALRVIWSGTLNSGDTFQFGESSEVIVIDGINKRIVAVLAAPPASTNPDFTVSYGDVT